MQLNNRFNKLINVEDGMSVRLSQLTEQSFSDNRGVGKAISECSADFPKGIPVIVINDCAVVDTSPILWLPHERGDVMIFQISNKMNKSNVRARFVLLYDRNNEVLVSWLNDLVEGMAERSFVNIDEAETIFNNFRKV